MAFVLEKEIEAIQPLLLPYVTEGDWGHILSTNQYEWYYSLSKKVQPKNILEIGVFLGYADLAMLFACPDIEEFWWYDNQSYGPKLVDAEANLRKAGFNGPVYGHLLDSQEVEALPIPEGKLFDIIHVDGDHSYKGALHDLEITKGLLAPGGVIFIDDIDYLPEVGQAVDEFLRLNPDFNHTKLDTYRGHEILYKG